MNISRWLSLLLSKHYRSFVKKSPLGINQEKYFKGKPRSYLEAKSLLVIDRRIAGLVDAMNCPATIWTTGSCEGHGWGFIKSSPYVAFKCRVNIAAALSRILVNDFYSDCPVLNYFWEMTAHFDPNFDLTYVFQVPGITSRKWFYATRRGVDQDLTKIELLFRNEISKHWDSQKVGFECKEETCTKYKDENSKIETQLIFRTLPPERINRIATATTNGSFAKSFATVNTFIKRHTYSNKLVFGNKLIVSYTFKRFEVFLSFFECKCSKYKSSSEKKCAQKLSASIQKMMSLSRVFWRGAKC
ncbi:hypothetical protein ACO0K3_10755 [Undibacterium sp. Rencai35W]|uniref:hypothetical protein n=1 Tax=Undibacterium sp. Rencai35W TaxID=3413046 RepID=UPI003BF20C22